MWPSLGNIGSRISARNQSSIAHSHPFGCRCSPISTPIICSQGSLGGFRSSPPSVPEATLDTCQQGGLALPTTWLKTRPQRTGDDRGVGDFHHVGDGGPRGSIGTEGYL